MGGLLHDTPMKSLPIFSLVSVLAGFATWQLLSQSGWFSPLVLPSPVAVWDSLLVVSTKGYAGSSLWTNLAVSIARLATGFIVAIVIGVPLGLAMGSSRRINAIFYPFIEMYRPLPSLAYLGLLVIWFGIGEVSKIVLLALAALPPIVLSSAGAVRSVRVDRIEGARSLGLEGFSLFYHVVFPSCTPDILTSIRVGFGFAYTTLVAAEMIGASSGIGWMVLNASTYVVSEVVIVGIMVIGVTGVAFDGALRALQRWLVPWTGRA